MGFRNFREVFYVLLIINTTFFFMCLVLLNLYLFLYLKTRNEENVGKEMWKIFQTNCFLLWILSLLISWEKWCLLFELFLWFIVFQLLSSSQTVALLTLNLLFNLNSTYSLLFSPGIISKAKKLNKVINGISLWPDDVWRRGPLNTPKKKLFNMNFIKG